MHGRVVFVTGGTRGIGAAICRSFAEQGAVLTAGYSSDAERARTRWSPSWSDMGEGQHPPGQRRLRGGLPPDG